MRVDTFLKISRLIRRRSLAKEVCDRGGVKVNGLQARAGRSVKRGDIIELDLWDRFLKVQVLDIPDGNVSKRDAASLYTILEEEIRADDIEW